MSRKRASRRITFLMLIVLLLFAGLIARAAYLGTFRASWVWGQAHHPQQVDVAEPAARGAIISTDGQFLALDQPTVQVIADGRFVENALETTDKLVSVLGGTPDERNTLLSRLSNRDAYVPVATHATLGEAQQLKKLAIDGVTYRRNTKRVYPLGSAAAQVLGFTDLETRGGVEGLEARLDDYLSGSDGEYTEVRDMRLGETVRILRSRDAVAGKSVTLTIHAEIQRYMEKVLSDTTKRYEAKGAIGIIMDPRSGSLLAVATVPRMNANHRKTLDVSATQVRAVTDPYEPGSVFKIVTVAAALEEKLTTPSTRYNVPDRYAFEFDGGTRYVRDAHERFGTVNMTTTEILQESSNIGTILISESLQKRAKLRPWMERFGFGEETGVDLNNESAGLLPPTPWNDGQRVNLPFGQGLTATALQQVRAYAAIANGGLLVTPHVVEEIDGRPSAVPSPTRIISKRTAAQMTQIMRRVVESTTGTGVSAQIQNYQVAGKTGTAEKVENGRYVKRYRSSFIGFIPADDPKLVISVMIDDPDPAGPYTAADVAAPAFQSIGDYALGTLGIAP